MIVDFMVGHPATPARLLFGAPSLVHQARRLEEVRAVLDAADRAARAGAWVVGFVTYEAAPAFDSALVVNARGRLPLAWFAVFPKAPDVSGAPSRLSSPHVPPFSPQTVVAESRYSDDVARIREYIAAGDVYQVNHTVPFEAAHAGDAVELYERLRLAQGGDWSACIVAEEFSILSASPELFFERHGDVVRLRPMKGTAPRGLGAEDDDAARAALVDSEKDRAENVMIVDLVRSDLGRIARTGSVRVTSLFDAERYPGVWQLTSGVEGTVDPARPLVELFDALFPSGSVTGTPKVRAMEIIRELEDEPREIYCGAIGVLHPGGDAQFNVAIRTAWTSLGHGGVRLNAGSAVTADSSADGELREVHAKLAAFTTPREKPGLFETLRIEAGIAQAAARHLHRMAASARYFGIPFDAAVARATLDRVAAEYAGGEPVRGRLSLRPSGELIMEVHPCPRNEPSGPGRVAAAASPVSRRDVGLYHKTTDRTTYDAARAGAPGMFDVILWNEEGEATELTRGNLVVSLGGTLYTPPLASGLLPGVLRASLLDEGRIVESLIPVASLASAESLWFINALRGWISIELVATTR